MRLDLHRQRTFFDIGQGSTSMSGTSHTPIKLEPGDVSQNFPYRFSPSPDSAQASPYQLFPPPTPSSASYHDHTMQYGANRSGSNSSGEGSVGSSSYSPHLQPLGAYHSNAGADPRYCSQHRSDSQADIYIAHVTQIWMQVWSWSHSCNDYEVPLGSCAAYKSLAIFYMVSHFSIMASVMYLPSFNPFLQSFYMLSGDANWLDAPTQFDAYTAGSSIEPRPFIITPLPPTHAIPSRSPLAPGYPWLPCVCSIILVSHLFFNLTFSIWLNVWTFVLNFSSSI